MFEDWAGPVAHIGFLDVDAVVPERVGGVAALEEDVGVWVLLDGPAIDCYAGGLTRLKRSCD